MIQPYTTSRKEALSITIKLLLKLSNNIYEQIWKPYCAKLAQWKKDNHIPQQNPSRSTTTKHRRNTFNNLLYNPNCQLCDLPLLQHENDTCPPLGLARRKIYLWSNHWILYSYPTNNILHYQI